MQTEKNNYCIALHAVWNRQLKHVADELLYRSSFEDDVANFPDPTTATARSCSAAFYEIGLEKLIGSRFLFFNVSEQWLKKPDIIPIPSEQIVVTLGIDSQVNDETIKCIQNVKKLGYQVSIHSVLIDHLESKILTIADIIQIDVRCSKTLESVSEFKKKYTATLMASYIESDEIFKRCLEREFDLFQGFFFVKPENICSKQGGVRSGNRIAELNLLKELNASEPNINVIIALISQDPSLCIMLLQRINSAGNSRGVKIKNIEQAVVLFGLDRLKAMTTVMLLAMHHPLNMVMITKLLTRAQMCRNITKNLNNMDGDVAFTVGLFSMMDQVLDISMDYIIDSIHFFEDISSALLMREGQYGKILTLVEKFERAMIEGKSLRDMQELNREYLNSIVWVESILVTLGKS
ncbi:MULTISPECIES: EAL and HDOD domain-containing protein [Nitrincola]|uniref:HDOD domain protein n=1 Tax=Nitrincola nitratireducens TaxID=1229521 RepID=W9V768_9GAMM|nr:MULTISPECIES: HDOD domain-containing protein [Nitrincola]EXJ11922.1 HDOD domain protein [Nitrincola nitratireducens]